MSHYNKTDNGFNNRKVINYDDLEEGELIEEDEINNNSKNDEGYSNSEYKLKFIYFLILKF